MATNDANDLMTSAKMAESLGVSPAKVKKVLQELAIEPTAKKGVCAYYNSQAMQKVKAAL